MDETKGPHEYELVNVLHDKVRHRYRLLGNDAVNAFLIFYAGAIRRAISAATDRYDRTLVIPVVLIVLMFDMLLGMPLRYRLHLYKWNVAKRLSECWSFFMGVVLFVSVQLLVESIGEWIDSQAVWSSSTVKIGRTLTVVYYSFYIVVICVFLQYMRTSSVRRAYKSHTLFTNRLAFGISTIISDIYFSSQYSQTTIALIVVIPAVILVEQIVGWLAKICAAPPPQHQGGMWPPFVFDQLAFISANLRIAIRVLTFILTQSALSRSAVYIDSYMGNPARVAIPLLLLLVSSSIVTAAMQRTSTAAILLCDHADLLQDLLFGLTIFVSRIVIVEINAVVSVSLRQITVVIFIFILAVVFSVEVIMEQKIRDIEQQKDNGAIYVAIHSWVDVANRLVIYIIIQLIVAINWSIHHPVRYSYVYIYIAPFFIVFCIFMYFPELGEMQSEHIITKK